MEKGSRTSPILLEDLGREFDTSDDDYTNNQTSDDEYNQQIDSDTILNECSSLELHDRSEEIHLDTIYTQADADIVGRVARWHINQRFGEQSISCPRFILNVEAESFHGKKAIEMMHRQISLDYGIEQDGNSRHVQADDIIIPEFFLDYICIIGLPMKPISKQNSHFFDNVELSLRAWHSPYSNKHSPSLPFSIAGRTFRLAIAASREHWFVVMHPKPGITARNSTDRQLKTRATAMASHHAEAMASYIHDVFASPGLSSLGVNDEWTLGNERSKKLSMSNWSLFQTVFMEGWDLFFSRYTYDVFWTENEPCFHAYDYGANTMIEVTEEMREMPIHDTDNTDPIKHEATSGWQSPDQASNNPSPSRATRGESTADDIEIISIINGSTMENAENPQETRDRVPLRDITYAGGLQSLQDELDSRYELANISSISFA
ncbi:hypothetical protein VHEMI10770 [[Torrubiella] hemipterigena]|uniref:Uncharacterized protein n=1 Tax=[Torrubiella] hemipterigena TaxID=1531966 RepID=A0A0A1TE38_9HYPO|nr:hypothetical protein VHEMI10770 [[Torrubiella] hemipterigena]